MKALHNYSRPTPARWRIVGDLALLLIPAIDGIVASAPDISDANKYWIAAGCTVALIIVKFATNFAVKK